MKSLEHMINEAFKKKYLQEGIEDVKKYYQDIDSDKFMKIISLDPTYKEGVDKVGNYGKWLLNLYKKHNLKDEDFYKVTDYLTEFEQKRRWFKNKDIQQFKSLGDLAKALDEVEVGELSVNQKDKQFKRELKHKDLNADKVFEDSNWEVWIPKDYTSSCKLASNTEWCTGPSSKGNSSYYDRYSKQGSLYIIINKQNRDDKFQFHFESSQFMNRYDEGINLVDFLEEDGCEGLKEFFMPILQKELESYCPELKTLSPDKDEDITIDCDLDFFLDSCEQYAYHSGRCVSEDVIRDILFNDGVETYNFYDGYDIGYEDLYRALKYNESEITSDEKVMNTLSRYNLSFDDFCNMVRSSNDDMNNDADLEDMCTSVYMAYEDAIATGTLDRAKEGITDSIIKAFKSIKFPKSSKIELDYNFENNSNVRYTCSSKDLYKALYNRSYYNLRNGDVYKFTSSTELCELAAENFECYEPRYGWEDFSNEDFVQSLKDSLR